MSNDRDFSAAESQLGYLYQLRYALAVILESERDSRIEVETLDDIVLVDSEGGTQILQTKHHVKPGNVTDRSTELWKSLRIWCNAVKSTSVDTERTKFLLVTTNRAQDKTIADYLKPQGSGARNESEALKLLREVSGGKSSKDNKSSYESFTRLSENQQLELAQRIEVLDCSLKITDIEERIKRKLQLSVRDEFLDEFFERVEGWWVNRVIDCLANGSGVVGEYTEVRRFILELQEEYHSDNLPIHFIDLEPPEESAIGASDRVFIEQLRLIMVRQPRIRRAISDYYKAYSQRSKWVREGNLCHDELAKYERRLIDEWSRLFEANLEELEDEEDSKLRSKAGRSLFNTIEQKTDLRIRPRCDEPYVMRGTYHILANTLQVGWHPDFVERLRELVEVKGEVAA